MLFYISTMGLGCFLLLPQQMTIVHYLDFLNVIYINENKNEKK